MVPPSEFHLVSEFRQSLAIYSLVYKKEAGLQPLRSRALAASVLKAFSVQSGMLKKPHIPTFPQEGEGGCPWRQTQL